MRNGYGREALGREAKAGPSVVIAARNAVSSSLSAEKTTWPDASIRSKYGMPCCGKWLRISALPWKLGHGTWRLAQNSIALPGSSSWSMLSNANPGPVVLRESFCELGRDPTHG